MKFSKELTALIDDFNYFTDGKIKITGVEESHNPHWKRLVLDEVSIMLKIYLL